MYMNHTTVVDGDNLVILYGLFASLVVRSNLMRLCKFGGLYSYDFLVRIRCKFGKQVDMGEMYSEVRHRHVYTAK